MGKLMTLIGDKIAQGSDVFDPLARLVNDPDVFAGNFPLRLAGALHGFVLENPDCALAKAYPPAQWDQDLIWAGLGKTIAQNADWIATWVMVPPQTNEIRRSSVIAAAARGIFDRYQLPLMVSEVGASAGLNLNFDRYQVAAKGFDFTPRDPILTLTPDWRGGPVRTGDIPVVDRAGVDIAPLDAQDPRDALKLRAYTWPDQIDRLERLEAALPHQKTQIERGEAGPWLAKRINLQPENVVHFIYHTVVRQYFDPASEKEFQSALDMAASRATQQRPVAHFSMEYDGAVDSAGLRLSIWPAGICCDLGRADFHGRWVAWTGIDC